MATNPASSHRRHALNLPAGSIRALLAIGVLAYLWILALIPVWEGKGLDKQATQAFIYLQFLMVLILAHFFVAHGKTIGAHISTRSPLGLPRGAVRFLLLGGYLGLAYYLYVHHPDYALPDTGPVVIMVGVLIAAFTIGYFLTHLMAFASGGTLPAWFQDIQAWFALIALILMGIVVLVKLVINRSLPLENQLSLASIEITLAAFVGFYFGARS